LHNACLFSHQSLAKWQLVDCPISVTDFTLAPDNIVLLAQRRDCTKNKETQQLDIYTNDFERRLQTAINTYQFNPTEDNRRELAHTQIEYQEYLSDTADRLQGTPVPTITSTTLWLSLN